MLFLTVLEAESLNCQWIQFLVGAPTLVCKQPPSCCVPTRTTLVSPLLMRSLTSSWGSILTTSSKSNHLPRSPPPNRYSSHLEVRASTCEFGGMSDSFAALWTVAHQAALSMGFLRQEYWSGLPFTSPGDLPSSG